MAFGVGVMGTVFGVAVVITVRLGVGTPGVGVGPESHAAISKPRKQIIKTYLAYRRCMGVLPGTGTRQVAPILYRISTRTTRRLAS